MVSNLKKIRKRNKMTQLEVAKQLNISQSAYNYYENGVSDLNTDALLKLSKLFNISIDEILGNEKYLKNEIQIPNEKKEAVQLLLALPNNAFNLIKIILKEFLNQTESKE